MSSFFVHPTAVVDPGAEIGEGSRVWHFVHVSIDARIGARCSLGQNVFVGRGVRLGDGVKVQNNVSLYEGVEIDDDVFLGPSVVFTNVFDPAFTSDDQKWRLSPTYLTYMNLVGDDLTVPGMYGGATPYRPSGVPAIPAVYQLAAPNTAIQGDPINVTIGTRSND